MSAVPPAPWNEGTVESVELRDLYHQLSNELGVILANAELLEIRAQDAGSRGRAAQIVTSVVNAMGTVRDLRARMRLERSASAPISLLGPPV
jgi:hypothetical protein